MEVTLIGKILLVLNWTLAESLLLCIVELPFRFITYWNIIRIELSSIALIARLVKHYSKRLRDKEFDHFNFSLDKTSSKGTFIEDWSQATIMQQYNLP